VPGDSLYGDYLRHGSYSQIFSSDGFGEEVCRFGGMVLGICNGFQILAESGLLPGALMRNAGLKYVCKNVDVRMEQIDTPFTNAYTQGEVLTNSHRPHGRQLLLRRRHTGRVAARPSHLFRYATADGQITPEANRMDRSTTFRYLQRRPQRCGHDAAPERSAEAISAAMTAF